MKHVYAKWKHEKQEEKQNNFSYVALQYLHIFWQIHGVECPVNIVLKCLEHLLSSIHFNAGIDYVLKT